MMYNFHYPKLLVTVGPSLAKETVLSKIMNFVDGFVINLSTGFDDKQKKYIDTILKLDNSKTVMLETKGGGITTKNVQPMTLSQGQSIKVDFSEYLEDDAETIYIDYPRLSEVTVGAELLFVGSDVVLSVTAAGMEGLVCEVMGAGTMYVNQPVLFRGYDAQLSFLNQKDRKDIQWGLQSGIHMMVGSSVRALTDLQEVKTYLGEQRHPDKKIVARIETQEAVDAYEHLVEYADSVILVRERLSKFLDEARLRELIVSAKTKGKPVIVTIQYAIDIAPDAAQAQAMMQNFFAMGVDGYMLGEETSHGEEPLEVINGLHELLEQCMPTDKVRTIKPFYQDSERDVIDYILYNVYRVVEDLEVRAIVCYTNTGYTAARLASFRPMIPVIAFTKMDDTYRYVNTLWGVKGYKISQHFNYENLKKIGKEMIRMMFKGSISLDEKILIVQVNEMVTDQANMINGIELYKFKNI